MTAMTMRIATIFSTSMIFSETKTMATSRSTKNSDAPVTNIFAIEIVISFWTSLVKVHSDKSSSVRTLKHRKSWPLRL